MSTSPLAWLTANSTASAKASPATTNVADDRFAQLLQAHRQRGADAAQASTRTESQREPASMGRQESSGAERNANGERAERNDRVERGERHDNGQRAEASGNDRGTTDRADSATRQDNGNTASQANDAPRTQQASGGQPDPAAEAAVAANAASASAKAATASAAFNPLVAQIHELTERSRLLADTVVALKKDPAALAGLQAEALGRALDGELSAVDPARLAQDVLPAALQELEGLSAEALAALPTELTDAMTSPAPAGDLAALAASAWQTLGGVAADAPRPGSGWQPPAAAAGLPLPGSALASAQAQSAPLSGTAIDTALATAVASRADDPSAQPLLAPLDAAADSARQMARQGADELALPAGLTPAPAAPVAGSLAPRVAQVNAPLGSPQWGQQFSQQMVRLSGDGAQGLRHAELRLDPPDLGPVRITLSLAGEQASAAFLSPHAAVRQAIEQALPQLQQALADAGIQLGQTSVGEQQTPGDDGTSGGGNAFAQGGNSDDGSADAAAVATRPGPAPRGLVDTFA